MTRPNPYSKLPPFIIGAGVLIIGAIVYWAGYWIAQAMGWGS